jgi:hypothetical protein
MDNVISEYQRWKQQGESLRVQAKQAMETRFRDLLLEAAQIAHEYQRDFSAALKPPPAITAFRYKKAGPGAKPKKTLTPIVKKPAATAVVDPKIAALQKQRSQIMKKLEAAKTAGKSTKNLDDKLYEVEDDLRLAQNAGTD